VPSALQRRCIAIGKGWDRFAGSPGSAAADGGVVMDAAGLEILVPALMGCAMLWWVGQPMSWTARFAVSAITVVLIIAVLLLGRVGL
jgi:hypothetical protein